MAPPASTKKTANHESVAWTADIVMPMLYLIQGRNVEAIISPELARFTNVLARMLLTSPQQYSRLFSYQSMLVPKKGVIGCSIGCLFGLPLRAITRPVPRVPSVGRTRCCVPDIGITTVRHSVFICGKILALGRSIGRIPRID